MTDSKDLTATDPHNDRHNFFSGAARAIKKLWSEVKLAEDETAALRKRIEGWAIADVQRVHEWFESKGEEVATDFKTLMADFEMAFAGVKPIEPKTPTPEGSPAGDAAAAPASDPAPAEAAAKAQEGAPAPAPDAVADAPASSEAAPGA